MALKPIRPIAFRSPVPAMPTTSVEKSSGAMIILIIRRKASASGFTATPKVGDKNPTAIPASNPMKICVVTPGRRLGRDFPPCAALEAEVARLSVRNGSLSRVRVDERNNGRDDGLLLLQRQLAVDRNGERLVRGFLGVREVAALIAEIGEARLQMER